MSDDEDPSHFPCRAVARAHLLVILLFEYALGMEPAQSDAYDFDERSRILADEQCFEDLLVPRHKFSVEAIYLSLCRFFRFSRRCLVWHMSFLCMICTVQINICQSAHHPILRRDPMIPPTWCEASGRFASVQLSHIPVLFETEQYARQTGQRSSRAWHIGQNRRSLYLSGGMPDVRIRHV